MVALGMSRAWAKKGYRPSYRHVSDGSGDKDVQETLSEGGLAKKAATEAVEEKKGMVGLGNSQEAPKESPAGDTSLDSSSKPDGDGTIGGTFRVEELKLEDEDTDQEDPDAE
ncbi:hypothetical protein L1987_28137 [Smallanthus sonchifolius]|uniref:Uncharacterized protein n=1 Tax=Smallanthus sonchifolius TaxID=185202 RepID=A0ACB9ICQ5_9ASTR|nr:hypothetical protein L1987_28137 [Smallanthus sonchifolius]